MSEIYLRYGECPECGKMCQPDYPGNPRESREEWVECEDCKLQWTLHHDDPNDKFDGSEPHRLYRISEVYKDVTIEDDSDDFEESHPFSGFYGE